MQIRLSIAARQKIKVQVAEYDWQQTYKIAKVLGVSVESLFDDKEVDKGSAIISDLKNIINKYQ